MDNAEFEEFYKKYFEFSIRIAEKLLKERSAAEDVSQEVFCSLYKIKDRLEMGNERKLRGLVAKASENKTRDYLRKTYVRQESAGLDKTECGKYSESAEAQMIGIEGKEYLNLIFERLRQKNQRNYEIYVAVKILDVSPELVAKKYNITRGNVNNRILRTKQWLKAEYDRIYGDA